MLNKQSWEFNNLEHEAGSKNRFQPADRNGKFSTNTKRMGRMQPAGWTDNKLMKWYDPSQQLACYFERQPTTPRNGQYADQQASWHQFIDILFTEFGSRLQTLASITDLIKSSCLIDWSANSQSQYIITCNIGTLIFSNNNNFNQSL